MDDLLQSFLYKTHRYKALARYDPSRATYKTYVFTLLCYFVKDFYEKRPDADTIVHACVDELSLESVAEERDAELMAVIESMDKYDREICLLHMLGLTLEEIAKIQDCSKQHIFVSLRKMRKYFKNGGKK